MADLKSTIDEDILTQWEGHMVALVCTADEISRKCTSPEAIRENGHLFVDVHKAAVGVLEAHRQAKAFGVPLPLRKYTRGYKPALKGYQKFAKRSPEGFVMSTEAMTELAPLVDSFFKRVQEAE